MDAVKFLEVYSRMCNKHVGCVGCPMEGEPICQCIDRKFSHEESERMIEIVEDWSKKNPDIIGKKYIIEIDKVEFDSTCAKTMLRVKGVKYDGCGEVWLNKEFIEQLTESKE